MSTIIKHRTVILLYSISTFKEMATEVEVSRSGLYAPECEALT